VPDLTLPETLNGLRVERVVENNTNTIRLWQDNPAQPTTLVCVVGFQTPDTDPFLMTYVWTRPELQGVGWLKRLGWTILIAARDAGYTTCEFRGLLQTQFFVEHGAVEVDPRTVTLSLAATDPFMVWGADTTSDLF